MEYYLLNRSAAVILFAKNNGSASAAQADLEQKFANQLAPGQILPSPNFFMRNTLKLYNHGTIEDVVSYLHLFFS